MCLISNKSDVERVIKYKQEYEGWRKSWKVLTSICGELDSPLYSYRWKAGTSKAKFDTHRCTNGDALREASKTQDFHKDPESFLEDMWADNPTICFFYGIHSHATKQTSLDYMDKEDVLIPIYTEVKNIVAFSKSYDEMLSMQVWIDPEDFKKAQAQAKKMIK